MRARRAETWAFAGAVGLHLMALAILGVIQNALEPSPLAQRATTVAQRPTPDFEAEVDVDVAPTPVANDSRALGQEGRGTRVVSRFTPPRTASPTIPSTQELSTPEPSDVASNVASQLDAPPPPDTVQGPLDLGIGPDGWQRWVTAPKPGERAPVARTEPRSNRFRVYDAPPASTTGGLQEGLEKHDQKLGVGPAGRVLSALHRASHQTIAPQVGVARFEVKVLRSGAVEVTLTSASGEVDAWRGVARHIADDLRASPPRIAPPRDGVTLTVELVAEMRMPNGVRIRSLESLHLEATPPSLKSTEKSVADLRKENPTMTEPKANQAPINLDLPGVYLAERGKVCSYRIGISALGPIFQGGCDPSNLGVKPLRMVQTRVIEERPF